MSFSYTVTESISGFKRTKLSTFISIITISISLMLLGVFAVITINASRFIDTLRNKVEMEAFLQEPVSRDDISEVIRTVSTIPGVDTIIYVSKDEAAAVFKEQFGEDLNNVLEFNPLPPSLKIFLEEGYRNAASANQLYEQLKFTKGIESVLYRKALLEFIDQKTETVHNITLGLGLLISLSAIFLVSNTIRLAIYAKRRILRTMELVGATSGFIKLPFLLEGIIQGLLGGIVAACILYILMEYTLQLILVDVARYLHMDMAFYLAVICTGIVLGLVGSVISVARFIKIAPHT
ncbi:MAG: Cell division protein FtsX [Bacteroidetes bacterium]|nr:Cell division protein FtsX [Bacteroidota bacterium]